MIAVDPHDEEPLPAPPKTEGERALHFSTGLFVIGVAYVVVLVLVRVYGAWQ